MEMRVSVARGLLEPTKRHHAWRGMHLEVRVHADLLIKHGVNKWMLDVQLMDLHLVDAADRNHRSKRLRSSYNILLGRCRVLFNFEHKVTPQKLVLSTWKWNELPTPPFVLQGTNLLLHGSLPF
jgi:hypothetical protein